MSEKKPIVIFSVYRWPTLSPEEFKNYYLETHAPLAKKFPGAIWYETFLNEDATESLPSMGVAPTPDAIAILQFESQEAYDNLPNTPEFKAVVEDQHGFLTHAQSFNVERLTFIPDSGK
jgi:uncharacterized protein (TIGR02118 family)